MESKPAFAHCFDICHLIDFPAAFLSVIMPITVNIAYPIHYLNIIGNACPFKTIYLFV